MPKAWKMIGNALLRRIALLGISLGWHLLIALRGHLLVSLGRIALLGVARGASRIPEAASDRPWLPGFFHLLSLVNNFGSRAVLS